jgi:sulfide:quinone oxidoreductase
VPRRRIFDFEQEQVMANIVVLGAGLGGTLMAYELKAELGAGDTLTVIGPGAH